MMYQWRATFQAHGQQGSFSMNVDGTDLLDAATAAQQQRPSFYQPEDLVLLQRLVRLPDERYSTEQFLDELRTKHR